MKQQRPHFSAEALPATLSGDVRPFPDLAISEGQRLSLMRNRQPTGSSTSTIAMDQHPSAQPDVEIPPTRSGGLLVGPAQGGRGFIRWGGSGKGRARPTLNL